MELDDLKQAWQQADRQPAASPDVSELIHQKSRGSIALLRKAFRKQMLAVCALMAFFIATQARNVGSVSSHILFWTFLAFCGAMIGMLLWNYRLTHKMASMDARVVQNLEQHIALMEQRLRWQSIGARVVILFFILLLEVIPLYQHVRMLDTWHHLSPWIRFAAYAAYLAFQYVLSRTIAQRRFGRHLSHLKNLLNEIR